MAITDILQCYPAGLKMGDPIFATIEEYKRKINTVKNEIDKNSNYYGKTTLYIDGVTPIEKGVSKLPKMFDEHLKTYDRLVYDLKKSMWQKRIDDLTEYDSYVREQKAHYEQLRDSVQLTRTVTKMVGNMPVTVQEAIPGALELKNSYDAEVKKYIALIEQAQRELETASRTLTSISI